MAEQDRAECARSSWQAPTTRCRIRTPVRNDWHDTASSIADLRSQRAKAMIACTVRIAAKIAEFGQGRAPWRDSYFKQSPVRAFARTAGPSWRAGAAQGRDRAWQPAGRDHPSGPLSRRRARLRQEEGIELTVQTTQGSQQALQLLAAGRADFVQVTPRRSSTPGIRA